VLGHRVPRGEKFVGGPSLISFFFSFSNYEGEWGGFFFGPLAYVLDLCSFCQALNTELHRHLVLVETWCVDSWVLVGGSFPPALQPEWHHRGLQSKCHFFPLFFCSLSGRYRALLAIPLLTYFLPPICFVLCCFPVHFWTLGGNHRRSQGFGRLQTCEVSGPPLT